jgi:hypothetical protein
VSYLQFSLDTIDHALLTCDATSLPPLGHTCLNPDCSNRVIAWLNPYYCSNECRKAANTTNFVQNGLNVHLALWQRSMLAQQYGSGADALRSCGIPAVQAVDGMAKLAGLLAVTAPTDDIDPPPRHEQETDTHGWLARWIRRNHR